MLNLRFIVRFFVNRADGVKDQDAGEDVTEQQE